MLQSSTYYRLVIGMHCFKLRISLKSLIVGERVVGGRGEGVGGLGHLDSFLIIRFF